jgi:hypothetical protein
MKKAVVIGKAPAWAKEAERSFKNACRKAIRRHLAAGVGVHVWKKGKVMKMEMSKA